jgi:nucleoside-diphosphate-sugar epimerase
MKIVVTGSSGRIGRAIHFDLCRDHQVVGIDRAPSSATTCLGDIGDFKFLADCFEGADAVIHTAALHAPQVGLVDDSEFVKTNIQATKNVVRCARENGIARLVFTSTTALYGHASQHPEEAVWVDEATTPQPRSIYHRTKLETESFLESVAAEDFRVVTLRMSRCFPEPAPVMALYRLHRGVDARDVARGHRLALTIGGTPYQAFILSGATPFRREDCPALRTDPASVISARCPELMALFRERGWRLPQSIDRVYDTALAQAVLGWSPRYGFANVVELLDAGISEVLPPEAAGTQIRE